METGVVITQEPVFTKTSVEEAHAGVLLDHSTMDVDKVNLSTVLAEVVNGSGNKETEESKHEKEEVTKTISVSKIVKEKESETETDEQGTVFVHEPKNTDDAKIILTDATLEKGKEDETTQKQEEVSVENPVIEEGQTETKHSQKEETEISKAIEQIPTKTDEVEEEKDSITVETSVNGTEAEHNETVSVEEISRKGENIAKETPAEQDETETVNTVVKDPEIVNNEETTVHDLKENEDTVEAIKNSDDEEQVTREVTRDRDKEDDVIIHKEEEVQESLTVLETPTIEIKDTESKASKENEEHEQVLVRDIPQDDTLVLTNETVNTSTLQESAVLKTLETKSDETDAEPSLDLKEEEETVTPSDEVQETINVVIEPPKPSPEQRSKGTEEDEHVLGRNMPQGEAESLVTKEDRDQEKTDEFEVPIDLAMKVDREELMDEKKEADQAAGAQSLERGLALNESGAEEIPVINVESGEQMEKPSLESPSKVSEETRKTLDEQIKEKPEEEEEEVAQRQEGEEEGSYGAETVPVPESIELKEKAQEERILDLAPLQDEEIKSDEVLQVSSASPEGETLVESKKIEVIKANEEEDEEEEVPDKIQSILQTFDTEPVKSNEETTVHESLSLKDDDSDPVEAIKNSDDAEQASHEVTGDREKEEDITIHKAQEVQESLTVVETPTIQGEDIELKASKDSEEHEHVLVRDIPEEETLVPKAETVNTSTVHESSEPSLDLKEQEETVKTVTPSDEVQESITLMELPKLSPEQICKDTEEGEHVLGSSMPQGDMIITEAESLVTKENKEAIMDLKEQEKTEKLEEVTSDLALKVDKEKVMDEKKEADEVAGGRNMERGLELNESEAELVDQNITEETQEKLVESPSEETRKTLDEMIQEKPEEEVAPHQEAEERVSVPESREVKEKEKEERSLDLTPLQEESCLPTEKNEEEIKEQIHKHEPANEAVKSDEVIQVSYASPEGETVVEATKNEEQVVADKIQSILETVETVDTEPVKSNEDDIAESLNSAGEEIQTISKDGVNVQIDETAETSVNGTEDEHNATVLEEGISKNKESIVPETASEEIKNSDEAEENSDKEKEEMQESRNLLLQEENTESESSKNTIEHAHLLVRDVPQIDTLVTEAEDVNTSSTVHKFESNEAEVVQETRKYIEPNFDLKEDQEKEEKETVISPDKVRPSDQVDDDVQTEESVEVKSKETLQVESTEEKHENLLDVPSGDSEKLHPSTVLVAETESQDTTEEIPSELVLKEELKDDKTEVDGTQVMGEQRDLEPHEPEAEQTDQTKTDEKVLVESVEKMQTASLELTSEEEEVTLQQEGSSVYGLEIKEEETLSVAERKDEESCLPKETTLQQESKEEYEPTNDQQGPVKEKSDEILKVSSEEDEGEIIVDAVKLANEEQVVEEIQRSLEPNEPEEQEQETVSETTEDEKVKKEEPIVQTLSEEDAIKSHLTEDAKKGDEETEGRDTQQGETIVNEAESVYTSTVQEAAVSNTLETNINESEEVHSPISGEGERQVTKEDTEPRLDLKEDKEQEEADTVILSDEVRIQSPYISDESQGREDSDEVKYKEKDAKLLDLPAEKMQRPSLESPSELSEETSKTFDEKIEEEVTLHQENEEIVTVRESSELEVQAKEEEEESCPTNEQKSETKEQMSEEDSTSAHQTPVEEKYDQASAAPLPQEREAEKIDDMTENEEEKVAEAVEPHSSILSPPEEAEKIEEDEEEKGKETEPMGDTGTGSSKMVEEEKLKQDKEILQAEEVPSSETQVMAVQLKREDNATTTTESHEEEATVALLTRDIETSLTDKFSIDQEEEEQANKESPRDELEGETQTRELEEENMVEKNDNETLIAETNKENEDKAVGLDASKTCTKQEEEFENLETPKVEDKSQEISESKGDQTPPSFISELEDQILKQIEEIHEEEEIKEAQQVVVDQTSSLVEEEETKESRKVEAPSVQNLPVEASHAHQTDDKTEKQVEEEIHQEETKPKESDETSTKVTKVEDEEDTKETDTQVADIVKGQSLSHAPEDACLEQEELRDLGTLQPGAVVEDQDSAVNENSSDEFTFSNSIGAAEHGDENSSTLLVVGILKELQTTLEEKERGINVSQEGYSSGNDLNSIKAEPETLEKSLVVEATPTSEIIEANMFQDSASRELEVNVEEQLQVETREIAVCKEETPADLSLTEVLHGEKIMIPSNQEEGKKQEDVNASTSEKISLQEEAHPRDFEVSKKEHSAEAQETVKEDDQTFDQEMNEVLTSEKKITEPLLSVAEKELNEEHVKSQAVSDDDTKSSNELDFPSEQIPKDQREEAEETSFEVKKVPEDKNEDTADALITSEKVQLQDQSKEIGQEKESTDLKYVQEDLDDERKDDGHDSLLAHKKDSDLIEEKKEVDYVKRQPEDAIKSTEEKNNMTEKVGQEATKEIYQEECKQADTATDIKEEIKEEEKETTEDSLNSMKNTDDEIKDYGLDSVVAQKKESGSIEEKKEVDYVKKEVDDAIKHGVSTEEKNKMPEKIGQEPTKEIYQEECKQTDTVTAIKEDIKEEEKETPENCLNSMKNTDDATEKTQPEIQEIEKLSSVSETQDKPPKQEDEVPSQQKREIADDVSKLENPKIAEEMQQKDGEEPARKSLSDLIQKVKVTDKTEVATTELRIDEEAKAEGEDEDGDEHKDDKTSPDSIVMVEAKDTANIIKTQKKSHGILSGVGSKVKHSISKVKKALTGKSSHTTKPSSPQ
ncbi:titin isoform X2 [Brassica napus]|uniref:titin isoform X2 n=1 Tax=Brassica napus TaxID=3708 RepID=UPI0020798C12|nr:titin isoform X2 [Brassica napus]